MHLLLSLGFPASSLLSHIFLTVQKFSFIKVESLKY
jgi:hypothetical protein